MMEVNYINFKTDLSGVACTSTKLSTFSATAIAAIEELSQKIEQFIRFSEKVFSAFEPHLDVAHGLAVNRVSKNPSEVDLVFLCGWKFGHKGSTHSPISPIQLLLPDLVQFIFTLKYPHLSFESLDDAIHEFIEMNALICSYKPIVNNLLHYSSDYSG